MKYFPKLGQPIHAERYDGTPESVERINAMLKEFSPETSNAVERLSFGQNLLDIELENGKVLTAHTGYFIAVHPTTEQVVLKGDMELNYSTSPVPIKPLEWDSFKWKGGQVASSPFGGEYSIQLDDETQRWECCLPLRDTWDWFETKEECYNFAQAHHETQVLSLLNLPE